MRLRRLCRRPLRRRRPAWRPRRRPRRPRSSRRRSCRQPPRRRPRRRAQPRRLPQLGRAGRPRCDAAPATDGGSRGLCLHGSCACPRMRAGSAGGRHGKRPARGPNLRLCAPVEQCLLFPTGRAQAPHMARCRRCAPVTAVLSARAGGQAVIGPEQAARGVGGRVPARPAHAPPRAGPGAEGAVGGTHGPDAGAPALPAWGATGAAALHALEPVQVPHKALASQCLPVLAGRRQGRTTRFWAASPQPRPAGLIGGAGCACAAASSRFLA